MAGALEKFRVLDLTHHIAGPYCTKLLAEFGAEVLKIERPGSGDPTRREGPFLDDVPNPETGCPFLYLNTGKKSITLDLKTKTGLRLFKELVKDADVVVENFEPRVMPSLGLGYDALARLKPDIVLTSISSFGQSGPYRDYNATEIVEYALGAMLYILGLPDREPLKAGGCQAQYLAGLNASFATLCALYGREFTGEGQQVDVSIWESVLSVVENTGPLYTYRGMTRKRVGNRDIRFGPISDFVKTKDGYICVCTFLQHQWVALAQFMGMPELPDDPRFSDWARIGEHADELAEIILPWFAEHTNEELLEAGQEWRVPFGLILTIDQLLENKHLKDRGFFVDVEHPLAGGVKYPGSQFRMEKTPARFERSPLLGEHNEEIYCGRLGLTREEMTRLSQTGVI